MSPTVRLGAADGSPSAAGRTVSALRNVRLLDGTLADLTLSGTTITSSTPAAEHPPTSGVRSEIGPSSARSPVAGPSSTPGDVIDATGWRVLPAASEPHAHLDKALSGERIDYFSGTEQNDLAAAIAQWQRLLVTIDEADIRERAMRAIERYVANGITSIRTHVDFPLTGDPMRGLVALQKVQAALDGVLTIQIVGLAGFRTPDAVVDEAIERGLDIIGGCPHISPDPHRETTRMLDLAERTGLPVDLHTDEQVPARELDIVDLAHQVVARGLQQRVTASHCVRLGSLPPERLRPVLEVVARAGLGIVTLPITNLYLQGWDATHLAPRGLTAVRAILDAGIPLAAGADNLRDPFNPVGRADPFETTSLLMTAGHLTPVEALAAVTSGPRTVMALPAVGTDAGHAADLVLVPDVDLGDVLAGAVDPRVVVHGGRVLADTRTQRSLALAPAAAAADPRRAAQLSRPVLQPVR